MNLIRVVLSVGVEGGGILHVRHDELAEPHVLLAVDDSGGGRVDADDPVGVDLELDLAHLREIFLPDLCVVVC